MADVVSGIPIGTDDPVRIRIEGGRIARVEPGGDRSRWLSPGLVDIHCHGGAGQEFGVGDTRTAARVHQVAGTTSVMASLVSAAPADLLARVEALRPQVLDRIVAGIHLEGPFLAAARRGAHDPATLQRPDRSLMAALVAAGHGTVRMVTIAPELPGAGDVIGDLVEAGVRVAVGHTEVGVRDLSALADDLAARGAPLVVTHLWNAMPSTHHRQAPGPALAGLAAAQEGRAWVELIADGVHLHPELVHLSFRLGGDRVVLVSDAMAAIGLGDGSHRLGSRDVVVANGIARSRADGSLAGSMSTLLDDVRVSIEAGVQPRVAFAAATSRPAQAVGLDEVGHLRVGGRADLLLLDAELALVGVWRDGHLVE